MKLSSKHNKLHVIAVIYGDWETGVTESGFKDIYEI